MGITNIIKSLIQKIKCRCECFSNCKLEIAYNASMRKKSKKNNKFF